MARLQKIQM